MVFIKTRLTIVDKHSNLNSKYTWWVSAIILILLASGFGFQIKTQSIRDRLEDYYGIKIELNNYRLPSAWDTPDVVYRVVPWVSRQRVLSDLAYDLSRYDREFVAQYLSTIYLFSQMRLHGQEYGGTTYHSRKWLYLDYRWLGDRNQTDEAMGFHHEFSSLLLKLAGQSFDINQWRQLKPEGFEYQFHQSSWRNLAQGNLSLSGDEDDYLMGVLCGYGTSTLEDDVNTYAQYLLAKPMRLDTIGARYPLVRKKAELLRSFYRDIGQNLEK